MFGTVLDKLSGWFGQSFLIARFFPLLVAIVANGTVAYVAFPAVRPRVEATLAAAATANAVVYVLLALGAVAALAYTLSPFVRGAIQVLEGGWMLAPGANPLSRWLGERLVGEESKRYDLLAEQRNDLFQSRAKLPSQAAVRRRLGRAREVGEALREIAFPGLIEQAATQVAALARLRRYRRPIPRDDLNAAIELLDEALRLNCADPNRLRLPLREDQRGQAERLTRLQRQMVSVLVVYARAVAEDAESRVVDRSDQEFAPGELAPTSFGNLSAALRSYCKTRYGIEFDYFWPRFLLAIQKNPTLSSSIVTANVQVEFAVVSMVLTSVSVILWFALFVDYHAGPWPLFLVAAIGPPLVGFWLRAVETSYKDYAA
ncbi:MAG TPA: hypothetical protein VE650_08425, partial [Acetobacteraceae bacterium]|nr:hypothetical protein [Acetobacteraceae bacterium]